MRAEQAVENNGCHQEDIEKLIGYSASGVGWHLPDGDVGEIDGMETGKNKNVSSERLRYMGRLFLGKTKNE